MLCHATVDDISFSLLICILIVVHLTTTTMVQHTTSTVHYLIRKVHDFTNVTLTKFVVATWYFIQNYLCSSKYLLRCKKILARYFSLFAAYLFLNEAKNHETQTLCNLLTYWMEMHFEMMMTQFHFYSQVILIFSLPSEKQQSVYSW